MRPRLPEESSYPAPCSPTNSCSRSLSPKPSPEPTAASPPPPQEFDNLLVNNGRGRAQKSAKDAHGHCPKVDSRADPKATPGRSQRDEPRQERPRPPRTRGTGSREESTNMNHISIDQDGRISFDGTKELDTAAIRLEQLHAASSWDFDPDREEWIERDVMIYFPPGRSTPGGIRVCEKLILIMDKYGALRAIVDRVQNNPKRYKDLNYYYTGCSALYVAKSYKTTQPAKIHYDELLTQAVADAYCQKFNKVEAKCGSKSQKVGILPVTVMRVNETGQFYNIEPFLPGKYQKFNDNFSYVHPSTHFADSAKNADMDRKKRRRILRSQQFSQLAQAFSHFTYHVSKGKCIVVDIQGVGTYYTDAQIHTHDGRGFGLGNLGLRGIGAFRDSHICAPACRALRLPPILPPHMSPGNLQAQFSDPPPSSNSTQIGSIPMSDRPSSTTGRVPPGRVPRRPVNLENTDHVVICGATFPVINAKAADNVMRECLHKATLEAKVLNSSASLHDPLDEAFNMKLNDALDKLSQKPPRHDNDEASKGLDGAFSHLLRGSAWAGGRNTGVHERHEVGKKLLDLVSKEVDTAYVSKEEQTEPSQHQKRKRQNEIPMTRSPHAHADDPLLTPGKKNAWSPGSERQNFNRAKIQCHYRDPS